MEDNSSTHAGVLAPPPVLYLGALFSGLSLQFMDPAPIASFSVLVAPALLILLLSAGIARWSFLTMRKHGTSASPRERSAELVTSGPFAHTRNPIYVAMTGLYLGLSFLMNSWWPLAVLLPLLLIMYWGVILREERYLATLFGDDYLQYKTRVRRWL